MSDRKIHVLEDSDLGGVLREYVEVGRRLEPTDIIHIDDQRYRMVERRAEIGETIISLDEDATENHEYSVGDILTVEDAYKFGRNYCVSFLNGRAFWSTDQYRVLEPIEPTDIVHIGGQRYRVVERKARPGEKIILTKPDKAKNLNCGDILIAQNVYDKCVPATRRHAAFPTFYIQHGNYCVLESINNDVKEDSDEPITADESQTHPQVVDMLANLSRRIVALERQIARLEQTDNSLHRDIETWAQEVERLKSRVKTESSVIKTFNLSDLDWRTLRIVTATDTGKENDFTTIVTFGRDVDSGEMFVLGCEVNAE